MLRISHPATLGGALHEASRGGSSREAGPEIRQAAPGAEAERSARPVERREAPPRLSARFAPGRDSRGRVAGRNSQSRPVLARGYGPGAGLAILRSAPRGSRKPSGVSRRSIPVWEKEKGTGGARAEQNNRAAQRWLSRASFRGRAKRAARMAAAAPHLGLILRSERSERLEGWQNA